MPVVVTSNIPAILAAQGAGKRAALQQMADLVLEDSQTMVPERTGKLKRSGSATVEGDAGVVRYTDNKAVAAHENMTDRLRRGRQAKFLETAVNRNESRLGGIVADTLRRYS